MAAVAAVLLGALTAGCGNSSDSSDPDATPTPTAPPTITATPTAPPTATPSLVTAGARIFFQETFEGNGRTCGTCHPPQTGFTLTPEFVASLPPDDALFVAETNPALAELENPALLRGPRALILENVAGFDAAPVFRGVPHIFDQTFTAPFGWSGSIPTLEDFAAQAVRQHFPKTLARIPGIDFRLPTPDEVAALVAFMQSESLQRPGFDGVNFSGTPAQLRGRDLFFARNCGTCHSGPLLTDGASFDTGVTRLLINRRRPPECATCDPIGPLETSPSFDTPTLLGLANSAPFFHDNSAATIREAVAHYTTPEFNSSEGALISGPIQMTEAEIDDVADFLTALTTCGNGLTSDGDLCDDGNRALGDGCRPNCTVERCGDGIPDPGERCDRGVALPDGDCTTPCAP